MNINPAFVDVEFDAQPEFVFGDKGVGSFRCGTPAAYGDSLPLVPESQWRDAVAKMEAEQAGAEWLVTRIYDQKNEGSCVANACSQALEIVQAKQFGKENVVHLSAMSLYQRIGSGPNSGAMVSDGLDEIAERGVLPLDTPENRAKYGDAVMPNTGWRNPKPANWEATAKLFKATEWFTVKSRAELISALLNGHPVVVGRAGHSICYVRPVYDGNSLLVAYANSWGAWGQGMGDHAAGFGFDSERNIRSSAGWAFALRSIVVN